MTIFQLFCFAWGFFLTPPPVFNPFANFKPVPKHWKAIECSAVDAPCHREHDSRVLALAIMVGDIQICRESTAPGKCVDVVEMILGDVYFSPRVGSGLMETKGLAPSAPSRPSGSGDARDALTSSSRPEGKIVPIQAPKP